MGHKRRNRCRDAVVEPFHSRSSASGEKTEEPTAGQIDPNTLLPHTQEAGTIEKPYEDTLDAYDQDTKIQREWHIDDEDMPYLRHIKRLSETAWPHLEYLAQWMEVTTSPVRWRQIKQVPEAVRQKRAACTNVAVIDFFDDREPRIERISKDTDLLHVLSGGSPMPTGHSRLYIVEDLSRNVIEHLGTALDIDPLFFREHINDYQWYNTLDPWVELPDLDIVSRNRSFFRLAYVQPRYFRSLNELMEAKKEAGGFNVLRRLDDDSEHKAIFDDNGAVVALVRSKASCWFDPSSGPRKTAVLLVDPPITAGYPLWRGFRPFMNSPPPSQAKDIPKACRKGRILEDLIFWIEHMPEEQRQAVAADPRAMSYRMVQIVFAEWLTLSRYIMTRLGQISWELEREDFRNGTAMEASFVKLHTWRRRLPLYMDWIKDMRRVLFRNESREDCLGTLRPDLDIISNGLDTLYDRTERVATVAAAVTSIEESRRGMKQNKSLARLTYLAVIFAPLSFVSSFFSMAEDLSAMSKTFWIYFLVAVPLNLVAFLAVEFKMFVRAWRGVFAKTPRRR